MGRTEEKHAAIVRAAAAEFKERGFQGTSMDAIAARAAVSKRTVYNHFPGKQALFDAIAAGLWDRAASAVGLPYDPTSPLRDQLLTLAHQELALLADRDFIDLARVALAEYFRSPELAREAFERADAAHAGLQGWVSAAAAAGRLAVADAGFASHQLAALLKAFAFVPQVVADEPAPAASAASAIAESAVDMFLARYATPEHPPT